MPYYCAYAEFICLAKCYYISIGWHWPLGQTTSLIPCFLLCCWSVSRGYRYSIHGSSVHRLTWYLGNVSGLRFSNIANSVEKIMTDEVNKVLWKALYVMTAFQNEGEMYAISAFTEQINRNLSLSLSKSIYEFLKYLMIYNNIPRGRWQ